MPTKNNPGQVYTDPTLTRIATKYSNTSYVWSRLFPSTPVQKMSGIYYEHVPRDLHVPNTARAIGAPANEVEFEYHERDFKTKPHSLKDIVADEIAEQADNPLSPLQDATEGIVNRMMLDAEKKAAALMTSNEIPSETLTSTDRWLDYDNSNPVKDVAEARGEIHSRTLRDPNIMVIPKKGYESLKQHPALIEQIKYSRTGVLTRQLLAELFEVDEVIVAGAGVVAKETGLVVDGEIDFEVDYLWGNDIWLVHVSPDNRPKEVTFGKTFTYDDRTTTRWYDADRKGTYVRTEWNYTQHIIAKNAAFRLVNALEPIE